MTSTPGPWTVKRQNPSPTTGEWMISGAKPGYLAEVRDCGSGDVEANANLISAAPELLEALIGVTRLLDAFSKTTQLGKTQLERLHVAQSVIKKAKGEPE